jgi:transcriptional regulator with XRE-family HTH domain
MSSAINICSKIHTMPRLPSKKSGHWLSRVLKERRDDKRISQIEIAQYFDVTQGTVSNYANQPDKLLTQDKTWVVSFIEKHGFNKEEAQKLAQRLFADDFKDIFGTQDAFEKFVIRDLEEDVIPVYASASAGSGRSEDIEDYIRIPKAALRGRDKKNVYGILVNGNCLVSHEVRFYARNIAHGDYVSVDASQAPKPNDVVLFWDNRLEQLIIKLYKEQDKNIVLYDASGIMVPKAQFEDDLQFKGVVFWRSGGTSI